MKNFLFLFFVLIFTYNYSQTNQDLNEILSTKKIQLSQEFGLSMNDHRGFIVYFQDQNQISYPIQQTFTTLQEAFQFYFDGGIKKDMMVFRVLQTQSMYPNFEGGLALDMNSTMEKYITLFNY
ncbi:MAG: hypothetical protein HYU67_08775 [Flavobacteriia bacterium]|nr:hypothetical protein [Flavobacteriia bacterium]